MCLNGALGAVQAASWHAQQRGLRGSEARWQASARSGSASWRRRIVLERIYKGGSAGHAGDDPLGRLLPGVGNPGGFRPPGPLKDSVKLVVLYTSGAEPDWPDALDPHTGTLTYFGDNRAPGRDLHDTPRRGNQLFRDGLERAAAGPAGRARVPPFLLFDKPGTGRDVRFRGLLARVRAARVRRT